MKMSGLDRENTPHERFPQQVLVYPTAVKEATVGRVFCLVWSASGDDDIYKNEPQTKYNVRP